EVVGQTSSGLVGRVTRPQVGHGLDAGGLFPESITERLGPRVGRGLGQLAGLQVQAQQLARYGLGDRDQVVRLRRRTGCLGTGEVVGTTHRGVILGTGPLRGETAAYVGRTFGRLDERDVAIAHGGRL